MEIWLRTSTADAPTNMEDYDRIFGDEQDQPRLNIDGQRLLYDGNVIGAYIRVKDGETQNLGIEHLGTVEWILVECETWSMIPLENLIAHRRGSHTKIAAVISQPIEAQGAGFALEEGVDALVISADEAMLDAARSVKIQRMERKVEAPSPIIQRTTRLDLSVLEVQKVQEAGVGDRYCLDFLTLFKPGEGVLVGSSASSLYLVHSETIPSTFVPTRPFRVNAGAPHTYVLMEDGTTKYLAELESGDVLLAVKTNGDARGAVLGRVKIEQRPMLKITGVNRRKTHQNANLSHVFMQQAETVRLITSESAAVSITDLKQGDLVLGWEGHDARHVGLPVDGGIEER